MPLHNRFFVPFLFFSRQKKSPPGWLGAKKSLSNKNPGFSGKKHDKTDACSGRTGAKKNSKVLQPHQTSTAFRALTVELAGAFPRETKPWQTNKQKKRNPPSSFLFKCLPNKRSKMIKTHKWYRHLGSLLKKSLDSQGTDGQLEFIRK